MPKRRRPRRHSDSAKLERTVMPSDELAEPVRRKPTSAPLPAPFYLAVDRQLKSGYDTYEEAEKVALTIKRQHPRLYVTVYEMGSRRHIVIEQPKLLISNGKRPPPADVDPEVRRPASEMRH